MKQILFHLYFTDEEAETQRSGDLPEVMQVKVAELGFKGRQSSSRVHT